MDDPTLTDTSQRLEALSWDASAGPPEIKANEIQCADILGKGVYGTVWRGMCRGKEVAIKKLKNQSMDAKAMSEFKREVEIMTSLRHPNVVLFMGACVEPEELAIVTELCPNGSVEDLLRNTKVSLSLYERIRMGRDVAQGMNWLHNNNPQIIHRDLKPSNLLLEENLHVKVCDFGLSNVNPNAWEKLNLRDFLGTPLWMAPEIIRGQPFDSSADVYSYGICLWQIVTKDANVFPDIQTLKQFKQAVCFNHIRPPIPTHIGSQPVPARLATLMEQCWDKHPSNRPTFQDIIPTVNDVLRDVAISDENGNAFWRDAFGHKERVDWDDFKGALVRFQQVPKTPSTDTMVQFIFLRHILGSHTSSQKDDEPPGVVRLADFGSLLTYFGPMDVEGKWLANLKDIMGNEWFHGDITTREADKLLADRRTGTFLVRMSTTQPGCFTLSKCGPKGVSHRRIMYKPNVGFTIKLSAHKRREAATITANVSLPDFISRHLMRQLKLKASCSGSKYAFLYGKEVKHEPGTGTDGYDPDPDTDDWM